VEIENMAETFPLNMAEEFWWPIVKEPSFYILAKRFVIKHPKSERFSTVRQGNFL